MNGWRICLLELALLAVSLAHSQQPAPMQHAASGATALAALLEEAQARNPQSLAARDTARAAGYTLRSAGALPDTQLMVQHFSVGSPRPFAGYTNSDFAYIGLGVAQEFPYPGKRKLRSEVAARGAESLQAQAESVDRQVLGRLKNAYFRLAYVQQVLMVFEHHGQVLAQIEQIAESRYRAGQGNQQEILRAQMQRTKILQEIEMSRREEGQLQAQIKQLLDRAQDSPDIVAETLTPRTLSYTSTQLLQLVRERSPDIRAQQAMVQQSQSQVALAQKEFRPDFSVQYMYQQTDRKFRDYYMLTLGINLPNRGRRRAELAEMNERQQRASHDLQAETQRQLAEVQQQYVVVQTSVEQLKIFKEGLVPQATATLAAALAAYQSNRQDFQTLLSSFLDALDLDLQYERALAEHESALAQIETLTGVTLP